MAPRRRVTDSELLDALALWDGNVKAAAESLGLRRDTMRLRLAALDAALRAGDVPGLPGSARECPENRAALYREHLSRPTLHLVDRKETRVNKRPKPPRVRPDLAAKLQQARFDIQAVARSEFDATDVLTLFFEDAFDDWLSTKLQALRGKA